MNLRILFLTAILFVANSASAYIQRTVMLKGKLIQFDQKIAIIETERGPVKVPSKAVTSIGYHVGQPVLVSVDIGELMDLNQDIINSKGK